MPGRRSAIHITLTGQEEYELERISRQRTAPAWLVQRARLVLLVARGTSLSEAARRVGLHRRFVREWARRYHEQRLEGLYDRPRSGRPPVFPPSGGRACRAAGL